MLKKLVFVCGPNGVGKSTACQALHERLNQSAYVDSDWCRRIQPFSFSEEIIEVITANISAMLIHYFQCSAVDHVIFSYGFHGPRKQIFDEILSRLARAGIEYQFVPLILDCSEEENILRMQKDGRDPARIQRALQFTRSLYGAYGYPCIDTTHLTVAETADRMLRLIGKV